MVQFCTNLVPRVPLLCLPESLEQRPWLRLVTWPSIHPKPQGGWVGTQLHLVKRTIKYHPGEGKLFWCLVLKHDFSAKTTESSEIPLSPCLSKFVTVTIKNPVAPPFQQIFLPPRFWVVMWLAATRVSVPTTKGGREERSWERGWFCTIDHRSYSSKLWSSQLWTQFKQLRIEAWKSQDFNGVWTRDLPIPVRRSNQLSYEATDVGSWSFVSSNEPHYNEPHSSVG